MEDDKIMVEMKKKNVLAYNASVQNVLADRRFLSYLLQNFLDDYQSCSRQQIQELIGDVQRNVKINKFYGFSNEDTSFENGAVRFDLLFQTVHPENKEKIGMLVNLELQNEEKDTSLKRMLYYIVRILHSQRNRIFEGEHYKDLVKVAAIWICVQVKKDKENSVNVYRLKEDALIGNYQEAKEDYDILELVTINLGKELKEKQLEPLNILFKSNLKPEEIFEKLKNEYDIDLYDETKKEVITMCNLGEGIYMNGVEKGRKEGLKKGVEKGKKEGIKIGRKLAKKEEKFESIINIMDSLQLTMLDAMKALKVPEKDYATYEAMMKEKMN